MTDTEMINRLQKICSQFIPGDSLIFQRSNSGEIIFAAEWGKEAPDSPMVGAALYGVGKNIRECIQSIE